MRRSCVAVCHSQYVNPTGLAPNSARAFFVRPEGTGTRETYFQTGCMFFVGLPVWVKAMRQSDEYRKIAFQIGAAELRIARMEKLVERLKAKGLDTTSAEELHALMLDTFAFLMRARSILEDSRRRRLN